MMAERMDSTSTGAKARGQYGLLTIKENQIYLMAFGHQERGQFGCKPLCATREHRCHHLEYAHRKSGFV